MDLYEKIKELAKQRKVSIRQVEEKLGFGNGTLNRWRTVVPSADKVKAVADYFDVSIDYLLGKTNMPRNTNTVYKYKEEIPAFLRILDEAGYKNWDLIEKRIYLEGIQALSILNVSERKFVNEYLWALIEKRDRENQK